MICCLQFIHLFPNRLILLLHARTKAMGTKSWWETLVISVACTYLWDTFLFDCGKYFPYNSLQITPILSILPPHWSLACANTRRKSVSSINSRCKFGRCCHHLNKSVLLEGNLVGRPDEKQKLWHFTTTAQRTSFLLARRAEVIWIAKLKMQWGPMVFFRQYGDQFDSNWFKLNI